MVHHGLPYFKGNLGIKFGWDFLSEPRPLKAPFLALLSEVGLCGRDGDFMPGFLTYIFFLFPYFLLDQALFSPQSNFS